MNPVSDEYRKHPRKLSYILISELKQEQHKPAALFDLLKDVTAGRN